MRSDPVRPERVLRGRLRYRGGIRQVKVGSAAAGQPGFRHCWIVDANKL